MHNRVFILDEEHCRWVHTWSPWIFEYKLSHTILCVIMHWFVIVILCVCVCLFFEGGNLISSFVCTPCIDPALVPSTQQVINKCFLIRSWLTASTLAPLAQVLLRHAAFQEKLTFLASFRSTGMNFNTRPSKKQLRKGHPTLEELQKKQIPSGGEA